MPDVRAKAPSIQLNLFEQFWARWEQPLQPANMHFDMRVPGVLDLGQLREAVETACALHPMTRAQLVTCGRWRRRLEWELVDLAGSWVDEVVQEVEAAGDAEVCRIRSEFFSTHVDVREAPALRFLVVHRPGGDTLLLSVNHTICDGVGALRFLQSVTRAYTGRPDPLPAIDPIAARDVKNVITGTEPRVPVRKARRRIVSTKIRCHATEPDHPCYGFHHLVLTEEETQSLNPRRLVPDATLNDLLLGAFLRTVDEWNGTWDSEKRNIVIVVPFNLRPKEWRNEVVVNLTMTGRVSATAEKLTDQKTVLQTVVDQTQTLKNGGIIAPLKLPGWAQLIITGIFRMIPALTLWTRATATLTNLGKFDEPPDFGSAGAISEMWISGGVGMPSGLLIGVETLNRRLHITFAYRHALFDDEAAEHFAKLYLDHVMKLGTGDRHDREGSRGR